MLQVRFATRPFGVAFLRIPASRLNVMTARSAAETPPHAVVKSDVASAVKLVAPPASDFACTERPIAVPTKPAITLSRSARWPKSDDGGRTTEDGASASHACQPR